jgi:hypothetical protein
MKKLLTQALGVIAGLCGLMVVPTLLYNLCGFVHPNSDCGDGNMEGGLIVLICVCLIAGAFYLPYVLFRQASKDGTHALLRIA